MLNFFMGSYLLSDRNLRLAFMPDGISQPAIPKASALRKASHPALKKSGGARW
jgi:hypothetical protein